MSLDNVTLRAATLDDLTGIAAIYNQLWCNTLRNRGDVEAADFWLFGGLCGLAAR